MGYIADHGSLSVITDVQEGLWFETSSLRGERKVATKSKGGLSNREKKKLKFPSDRQGVHSPEGTGAETKRTLHVLTGITSISII